MFPASTSPRPARALVAVAGLGLVALLSACSGSGSSGGGSGDGVQVAAAFYPLQFAVQQVGGEDVSVTGLTKPGTEPHDLELTPKDVTAVASADLVVYEKGFQPAVDDAVTAQAPDSSLDVSGSARLTLAASEEGHDHGGEGGQEHAEDEHDAASGADPHFWLDPTRYADVATAIGQRLGEVDPEHATAYTQRASDFAARLRALDDELKAGLTNCSTTTLVTGHAAFGYLADRYGLTQVGVTGVSPDIEPSAVQLKEVAEVVEQRKVTTVYAETLVSPALVETLGRETGAKVAVLDPVEGITDESAGDDYFEVMRANLTALRAGQGCG